MPETLAAYPPLGPHWQGLDVLARGANRLCVRDPDDAAACLKFELAAHERTRASLRERLRRAWAQRFESFGENAVELRAYQHLYARWGEQTHDVFAIDQALVDTRWGRALRCTLVREADGQPARSLYAHLFAGTAFSADALCQEVDRVEAWLLARHVPLFDLNAGNFVVATVAGRPRLICVDAKSTLSGKELLPLSRWLPSLMRRKIQRRAGRLRQRIRHALAELPPPH